jgi:RNA polymerase sigma-70 factor, ECF subfamily
VRFFLILDFLKLAEIDRYFWGIFAFWNVEGNKSFGIIKGGAWTKIVDNNLPNQNWDDQRLVTGLQARDPKAVEVLFELYADRLFNYVYYHSGHRTQAEDIVSETLYKVLENIPNYQWRNVPFKAWIFRIARNLLIDYFRQRDKKPEVSLDKAEEWNGIGDAGAADGGDIAELISLREDLRLAIARLPEEQRNIFVLRFIEGFDLEQVSSITGRGIVSIKSLQYRAVRNLRIYLTETDTAESSRGSK